MSHVDDVDKATLSQVDERTLQLLLNALRDLQFGQVTAISLIFAPVEGGKRAECEIKADGTFTASGGTPGKTMVTYAPPPLQGETEVLKPGESMKLHKYAGLTPEKKEIDLTAGANSVEIKLIAQPKVD